MKFARAAGAALACLAIPAFAQQVAQSKERIEVTGTSIKRIDAETALPVQIVNREEIERTGAVTTEELLKSITASTTAGGVFISQSNGTITTSQSNISLRGLGATRTLVLVNGRRVTVFGGTNALGVDVNSIPIAAIERIEVLKDGASSLYGSDAIAGVVNFILRKDYKGAEIDASYGEPTRSGGGKESNVNVFAGIGDLERDGYNLMFGVGWKKVEQILGSSRSFAHQINVPENNDLSSTIAFPGNILFGSRFTSLASPAFPNCGPFSIVSPFFTNSATSGRACRFENSPYLSIQPQTENKFAMANGTVRLRGGLEAYFEAGYTRNEVEYQTQPVPIAENTALPSTNPYVPFINHLIAAQYPTLPTPLVRLAQAGDTLVLLPTTSPYYPTAFVASLGLPTNQPIAFRYRDFVQGMRETRDSADTTRLVTGLKGTQGAWDFDAALSYSESKAKSNLLTGYPLTSAFLELLDTGVINPFGPTTDSTAIAAAQAAEFTGNIYTSKTSASTIDARASRDMMELQGGPAAIAVGAQFSEEKFTFDPSAEYQVGDIGGFGGNILGVDRKRHVTSVFTEIAAPFWRQFEADLGVRYDNYQGTGSTTNPKLSFRWNPSQELLFRGSVGSGFRAPSLTDLYTPQATSVTPNGSRDLLRCPNAATGAPADCNNQFPTIIGGNPDLEPEKSLNRTLGLVFEPNRAFSMGVDAFWISLKNSIVIGGLAPAFILANPVQYSSYIIRGAPDGNPSGVGPIQYVVQTTSNLFKQKVTGFDVSLRLSPELPRGRLVMKLDGTYFDQFLVQNADGSYTNQLDRALRAGGGVITHWRHIATGTYTIGPWDATLQQNFQKGYNDVAANLAPAGTPIRQVGVYETYDVQGAYNGIKNLRLALGMKNIFDRDPPYTNEGGQFAAGYDITYADVRGRFVYGSGRSTFK